MTATLPKKTTGFPAFITPETASGASV